MILVDGKEDLTGNPRNGGLNAIGEAKNDTEADADAEKGIANRAVVIAAVLEVFVGLGASTRFGLSGKVRQA